jgi:hypothetical protein
MSLSAASRGIFLLLGFLAGCLGYGQEQQTLEQRQPLELVFADSIVPQDRHEAMFTTGGWYSQRQGDTHAALLTQKVEWGISDKLQVSTFVHALQSSDQNGLTATGMGDFEVGARYAWATVRSPFTHIAVAFDAGFPTGNPTRGLGEAAYTVSPSLLLSQEFSNGKYQVFTTDGFEFVVAHRNVEESDAPHHSIFSNSGVSMHLGHGWAVGGTLSEQQSLEWWQRCASSLHTIVCLAAGETNGIAARCSNWLHVINGPHWRGREVHV